jgi:hypothetical protein
VLASDSPPSRVERLRAAVLLIAALAYLATFVGRGWVPHDEGMLGQSAEEVLNGSIPHLDYQEAYTGGLSWLYAGVFKLSGIDLLNLRWFFFAIAACAVILVYVLARRFLSPTSAALTAWVALVWSFPNYFAALPSWWLLVFSLACLWSLTQFIDTGDYRHTIAAGLWTGLAILVKQTGLYLLVALVLSILFAAAAPDRDPIRSSLIERLVRWGAALASVAFAVVIIGARLFGAEGLYLVVPIAACAATLATAGVRRPTAVTCVAEPTPAAMRPLRITLAIALAAAVLPVTMLLLPYVLRHDLSGFFYAAFVLPRKRLDVASMPMPGVLLATATSLPVLTIGFLSLRSRRPSQRAQVIALSIFATLLPLAALTNIIAYQFIWQAMRTVAALLPVLICWRIINGHVTHSRERTTLFAAAVILSWMSLNQFPFSAPIYFLYTAPLAIVAAVAAASETRRLHRPAMLAWAMMLLLFGVLSPNRAFIDTLGASHAPQRFDAELNLPRANLRVRPDDAQAYSRLIAVIHQRLGNGRLVAGPDCPEVYFLAGVVSPTGTIFDSLSATGDHPGLDNLQGWMTADVIVVNRRPQFSAAPAARLMAQLRRSFPTGEEVGGFEIRWR